MRITIFKNNEIRNESIFNFIPLLERKKTDSSILNKFTKSLERHNISNLNSYNGNIIYKINRNEEIKYEKYLNQTGFYDFDNLFTGFDSFYWRQQRQNNFTF